MPPIFVMLSAKCSCNAFGVVFRPYIALLVFSYDATIRVELDGWLDVHVLLQFPMEEGGVDVVEVEPLALGEAN